ncbi:Uncharacterized protein LW93_11572 [Fusarium fujikuroi]|nr:Uncharacterized protein LW93_11572 [Fusarium fujikuroi]
MPCDFASRSQVTSTPFGFVYESTFQAGNSYRLILNNMVWLRHFQHLPAPSINHVPIIPPYNNIVWHVVALRVQDKVAQIYDIWRYHKSEICCMYFQRTSRIRPFAVNLAAEFQGTSDSRLRGHFWFFLLTLPTQDSSEEAFYKPSNSAKLFGFEWFSRAFETRDERKRILKACYNKIVIFKLKFHVSHLEKCALKPATTSGQAPIVLLAQRNRRRATARPRPSSPALEAPARYEILASFHLNPKGVIPSAAFSDLAAGEPSQAKQSEASDEQKLNSLLHMHRVA